MSELFSLNHLTHYYGSVRALYDVTISVGFGAVGLVGQNGAGKSTLMQILLGLIRPTQGSAQMLGRDVSASGVSLRGRLGYMSERPVSIPGLKGVEYVALAGELCGMPRRQALRRAHETLTYLGLEDARYRALEEYSIGMTQRLKLAASLVHDPDVLVLDEPTSGLDPEGRQGMLALLKTLAARPGKALIFSSHLLSDIEKVCHIIVIINAGEVVAAGSMRELNKDRTASYRIRWEGDAASFLEELNGDGVEVFPAPRRSEAQLIVPQDWRPRTCFELARRHALRLVDLEPERDDLDAVYRRLVLGAHPPTPSHPLRD